MNKKPMMSKKDLLEWLVLIGLGILCYMGLAYLAGEALAAFGF